MASYRQLQCLLRWYVHTKFEREELVWKPLHPASIAPEPLSFRSKVNLMLEAVQELSPPVPISTLQIDVERQSYIAEADAVGSIPPPKSALKSGREKRQRQAQDGEQQCGRIARQTGRANCL
jgi:hypothetical protein